MATLNNRVECAVYFADTVPPFQEQCTYSLDKESNFYRIFVFSVASNKAQPAVLAQKELVHFVNTMKNGLVSRIPRTSSNC